MKNKTNREIKFRAKTTDGIWFHWKLTDPIDMPAMEGAINWDTLGQFTGLLDKNENPIYEGDVISCLDTDTRFGHKYDKMEVTFYNGEFGIGDMMGHLGLKHLSEIEVIGNVYQHRHLLENN